MMRCDRNSRIALNCHRTNSLEPWNLFVCNSLWQLAVLHATRVFRITIFSHFIDVEVFHGEFAMNTQCCNHFPATFCLKQSRSVQVSAIMPSHKIVPFELASDPRHRELDTPVPLSSLLCPAECFYLGSPCVLKVRFWGPFPCRLGGLLKAPHLNGKRGLVQRLSTQDSISPCRNGK